jgi:broad-specificity NMP kinase
MSQEDFQQQVLRSFEEIDKRFTEVDKQFTRLEADIKEVKITSEAYQKASTQVVSLAFGLISAAAAVVILSPAVKALTEFFLSK